MTWLAAISAFLAGFACGAAAVLLGWSGILRFADWIDTEAEKELRHD